MAVRSRLQELLAVVHEEFEDAPDLMSQVLEITEQADGEILVEFYARSRQDGALSPPT